MKKLRKNDRNESESAVFQKLGSERVFRAFPELDPTRSDSKTNSKFRVQVWNAGPYLWSISCSKFQPFLFTEPNS